ncbi:MAG: hypothetical protein ABIQ88_17915 [Chitinophagaceae bacterium]
MTVIRYSNIDVEWQERLHNGIDQWVQSKISSLQVDLTYDYGIGIISAIKIELAAVKRLGKNWTKVNKPNDPSPYYETTFEGKQKTFRVITGCAPQMGMNASAVLSMKIIQNFRPKYLFMIGIVASVKTADQHGYGDIIIIDECWDGGAGKITQDEYNTNIFSLQPIICH